VRLPELSRRAVLGGASATPLANGLGNAAKAAVATAAPVDPTIAICQRWLEIEVERGHLQIAWGRHESWLARERNWFGLSQAEREALPEASKLRELDERMEALSDEGWALLDQLPSTPATSVAAVIANLTIAGTILGPEDYPTVHQLVVRAVDDLVALS
jgi:transposase